MQGEPDFWNNQEKAQKTIQAQKTLNALLKPYEEVAARHQRRQRDGRTRRGGPDARGRARPARSTEAEHSCSRKFELHGDDERQAGRGQRDRVDQARGRRDRRLRLGRDPLPHVRPLGPAARVQRSRSRTWSRTWRPASRASRSRSSASTPTATCRARSASTGWCASARSARATRGRRRSRPWMWCRNWTTTSRSRSRSRDLEMQTFCSGGPGGQHQNKTQSGVRLIHKSGRPGREPHRAEPAQELRQRAEAAEGRGSTRSRSRSGLGDVAKRYDAKGEIAFGCQIRSYVLQPYTLVRDERPGSR